MAGCFVFCLKHPYPIWCRQKDLNILEFLEPVCFKYHFPLSALFCLLLFCASQSLREVYEENNSQQRSCLGNLFGGGTATECNYYPCFFQGWPMYAQLLIDLFKYLAPFLRNVELTKPMQILYKVINLKL